MKKRLLLLLGILLFSLVGFGQQIPSVESYFINKYTLSPSYAGNSENGYLFGSYQRYWTHLDDAPRILRLSYQNGLQNKNIGFGVNILMDKAGAFQTFFAMVSYSYRMKISYTEKILFGISAGINRSSFNSNEFMNDPIYINDPVLSENDLASNSRFVSEISMVYVMKNFQIGLMSSTILSSEYTYTQTVIQYNPFSMYQFHAFYTAPILEDYLQLNFLAVYKGGKYVRNQFEFASQLKCNNEFWGSVGFRGQNMFSVGAGIRITNSIIINYNYYFPAGKDFLNLSIYQFSLGIKL